MAGDILILDNAPVHGGLDSINLIIDLLSIANIKLVFLLKYSPELNPIELVFMYVKRVLREYRNSDIPLWLNIAAAFSLIDFKMVKKYYVYCLTLKNKF